jgi:hypothetical protein
VVALERLAAVALATGQPDRAARLGGAAERLRRGGASGGGSLAPVSQAHPAAWAEGRTLSTDQVVALALAPEPDPDPGGSRRGRTGGWSRR